MPCSNCKGEGHNRRTCPFAPKKMAHQSTKAGRLLEKQVRLAKKISTLSEAYSGPPVPRAPTIPPTPSWQKETTLLAHRIDEVVAAHAGGSRPNEALMDALVTTALGREPIPPPQAALPDPVPGVWRIHCLAEDGSVVVVESPDVPLALVVEAMAQVVLPSRSLPPHAYKLSCSASGALVQYDPSGFLLGARSPDVVMLSALMSEPDAHLAMQWWLPSRSVSWELSCASIEFDVASSAGTRVVDVDLCDQLQAIPFS